jgi:superfamily II DNA helicase RecQ
MISDEFRELWKISSFTRRILGFVFDEGHCISQWGQFRKHYLAVGMIRYLISDPIPFYVASATLPTPLITEIRRLLHMSPENTTQLLCSNERPDIALMVRELSCPSSSFEDLAFLIPYNWQDGDETPKKFLVFFDDIKAAEQATKYFHGRLLQEYHSKIAWFHSTMSQEYRETMVDRFRKGEVWGLFCTDAFGLVSFREFLQASSLKYSQGMDVGDVEIVVQYKATCDLCTLWQRFGRAARAPGIQGVGILLVERKDTVDGRKNGALGSKRNSSDLPPQRRQRQRTSKAATQENSIEGEQGDLMEVDMSCQPTLSPPDQTAWSCERQARYSKPEIAPRDLTNTKKGKAPGVLPGTAIDDYINLPSYVSCRRLVPQLFFANNQRSQSLTLLKILS